MDFAALAGWVAPIATMIAAMMTAANLGARVTGWGFITFTIGSIAWSVVAITTDQDNLLWTNGFLTVVNAVGIWRWLGRRARYDDGGQAATEKSAQAPSPTLFALGALSGRTVTGPDGLALGTIVDGMMRCPDAGLAYIIISQGGVGGIGESLRALTPDELCFGPDHVTSRIDAATLATRPTLAPDDWPVRPPSAQTR